MIKKSVAKGKKMKTANILDAAGEPLGTIKNREQVVRKLAGWLSHEEAQ
jgi:hypothetical protein